LIKIRKREIKANKVRLNEEDSVLKLNNLCLKLIAIFGSSNKNILFGLALDISFIISFSVLSL